MTDPLEEIKAFKKRERQKRKAGKAPVLVLVPRAYRAEVAALSKAELMDVAWVLARLYQRESDDGPALTMDESASQTFREIWARVKAQRAQQ